ncbi:MAG: VWA domain-containing protein [Actinomycetota bacterium]|nr:VWA domain-containing protein [Actinomycetota bacterium]
MRTMLRLLLTLAIVGLTAIAPLAAPHATAGPGDQSWTNTSYQPVLVVLDTSSSMSEDSGDGTPRIDAARHAVRELANSLDPNSPFGMLAYPGRNSRSVDGCVQGRVEVAVKDKVHLADVSAALRQLSPDGDTPTGPALTQAAGLLKAKGAGHGTIVLVSDGESNCGAPPCEVAKKLSSEGFEVVVNTVGFRISDEGARELRCISNTTGGKYIDATDPTQLNNALQDSFARLELTVSVPKELAAVSGTSGGTPVRLTVQNTGLVPAQDVRVSLDFRSADDKPGVVLVPRPVRFLGNLSHGIPQPIDITVRPSPEQANAQFSWIAVATAANAAPVVKTGKVTVVEPFGHLTGLLAGITDVAILGDSYSSGEGAYGTYLPGTDDKEKNLCHRSAKTYGRVLFPDARIIACSGATINEFYQDQKSEKAEYHLVVPQLMKLLGRTPPQAVLMSIGGNDALFGPILTKCATPQNTHSSMTVSMPKFTNCQDELLADGNTVKDDITAWIASMANDLSGVYRDVDRAINDSESRAMRGGGVAPIVVVPYPRIIPTKASKRFDGCFADVSHAESDFLNDYIDQLNDTIAASVAALQNDRVPVYFATDVIEAFQPDHTICDSQDRYANTVSFGDVTTLVHMKDPEMAHPNVAGYAAMARAISAWSARQAPIADPALPPDWSSRTETKQAHGKKLSLGDLAAAGGRKSVFGDGYEPGSEVILRVDSAPRMVGSAVVDDDGNVHADIVIPIDTPPGTHHIRMWGFGVDGALREQSIRVRVLPPHALAALVGLVVSVGLISVAAAGMVAGRRARGRGE